MHDDSKTPVVRITPANPITPRTLVKLTGPQALAILIRQIDPFQKAWNYER